MGGRVINNNYLFEMRGAHQIGWACVHESSFAASFHRHSGQLAGRPFR